MANSRVLKAKLVTKLIQHTDWTNDDHKPEESYIKESRTCGYLKLSHKLERLISWNY